MKIIFGWFIFIIGGLLLFGVAIETVALVADFIESGHPPDFIMISGSSTHFPGWYIYIVSGILACIGIGLTWVGWRYTKSGNN